MKMNRCITVVLLGLVALAAGSCQRPPKTADLLITGGLVYDGTENEPRKADIAVVGDRIVYFAPAKKDIASRCAAKKTVDAEGYVVSPGFIDPHDHLETYLQTQHTNEAYLRMGVTTVISGQCGMSRYPISEYFKSLEEQGIGSNFASFVGHNTIRGKVIGNEARYATPEEMEQMKEMVRQEMRDGCFGFSTGLAYVPGCFSDSSEVVNLARAAAEEGGIYSTHVRNENKFGLGLLGSIHEALEIGRVAGMPVNISHLKCMGQSVWHRADSVIAMIEDYQKMGMKVTGDQYPYLASGPDIASALTPSWSRDGGLPAFRERIKDPKLLARIRAEITDLIYERGGEEHIFIGNRSKLYPNMMLSEAAARMNKSPEDAVIEILKTECPLLNTYGMCDEDVEKFMVQPWVMTCTDGLYGTHPRVTGTYAVMIKTYVLEKKLISLGRFIRRSTGQVADTYGLEGRGYIRKGAYADITIFKPEEVCPHSTPAEPSLCATGFKDVIVNGVVVVEDDVYTGELPGMVIRYRN